MVIFIVVFIQERLTVVNNSTNVCQRYFSNIFSEKKGKRASVSFIKNGA